MKQAEPSLSRALDFRAGLPQAGESRRRPSRVICTRGHIFYVPSPARDTVTVSAIVIEPGPILRRVYARAVLVALT